MNCKEWKNGRKGSKSAASTSFIISVSQSLSISEELIAWQQQQATTITEAEKITIKVTTVD